MEFPGLRVFIELRSSNFSNTRFQISGKYSSVIFGHQSEFSSEWRQTNGGLQTGVRRRPFVCFHSVDYSLWLRLPRAGSSVVTQFLFAATSSGAGDWTTTKSVWKGTRGIDADPPGIGPETTGGLSQLVLPT